MPNLDPSLQFYDSVDHYTTLAQCALKWNRIDGILLVAARTGKGINLQAAGRIGKTISHTHSNVIGFAFKVNAIPNGDIYQFYHVGVKIGSVSLHDHGVIKYNTATGFLGGGTFHTSLGGQFSLNTWHYLEVRTLVGGTGEDAVFVQMEVRIDEVTLGEFSGSSGIRSDTLPLIDVVVAEATVNYHELVSPNLAGQAIVDDIYIRNDTIFMGDTSIFCLYPNGDEVRDFLPVEDPPKHFSLVNQHSPDDDTTYIESQFVATTDLFDWEDVPTNATIKGIHYNIFHRKSGEFTRAWEYVLAGSLPNAPKIYPSDSYRYDSVALDGMGGQWTPDTFNPSKWGIVVADN